jgi:hypothetical protein
LRHSIEEPVLNGESEAGNTTGCYVDRRDNYLAPDADALTDDYSTEYNKFAKR